MSFSLRDASRLYGIEAWGHGYFGVGGRGHLTVHPCRNDWGVDLFELVPKLERKGLRFPILLRFPQILESRVEELFGAFERAIREFGYAERFRGVFPIKVNQHSTVLNALVKAGREHGMGLEAGSRAELAVALSHELSPEAVIICNGYKDAGYIRLALRGMQMGKRVFLIAEKLQEIPLILDISKKMGVEPLLGIRIRLRTRSSGKWEKSSGSEAKFGLTTTELLEAVELLEARGRLDCFRLVHFHAGSQITEIKRIKNAVKEGARIYAKLRARGCPLDWLNVGGGLGVDYDGSNTSYEASMNYTVTEYANDVVYIVQEICLAEEVPVPTLVSESGRALTAYHAVLLSEVSGANQTENGQALELPVEAHESLTELHEIYQGMTRKNHREYFHDAEQMREELLGLFDLGYISLYERALTERLMSAVSRQALLYAKEERRLPDEFEQLQKRLVTKYIANFSVFQSIPDSWALDQLFPLVPIHRLNEKPTVAVTLCDVTCDSDGEVDRFVDVRDVKDSLDLHELKPNEPYYIAVALIGAYQDVLGDYHNLFGRVDEAHIRMTKKGVARIVGGRAGDDVHEVVRLFGHAPDEMVTDVESRLAAAVEQGTIEAPVAAAVLAEYRTALAGYTYLDF